MSTDILSNRKMWIAAVCVLGVGAGVWGAISMSRSKKSALPKEIAQSIQAGPDDPGAVWDRVHQAMQNPNLTEAQRHEIWQAGRAQMEVQINRRLDAYFAATTESQRQVLLDQQLDEFLAHRQEWEARRAQWQQRQQQGGPGSPGAQAGPAGPGGRFGAGGPPREVRKQHSESRSPDQRARRMAYFSALHARAQQRGIQLPFGPGR